MKESILFFNPLHKISEKPPCAPESTSIPTLSFLPVAANDLICTEEEKGGFIGAIRRPNLFIQTQFPPTDSIVPNVPSLLAAAAAAAEVVPEPDERRPRRRDRVDRRARVPELH